MIARYAWSVIQDSITNTLGPSDISANPCLVKQGTFGGGEIARFWGCSLG